MVLFDINSDPCTKESQGRGACRCRHHRLLHCPPDTHIVVLWWKLVVTGRVVKSSVWVLRSCMWSQHLPVLLWAVTASCWRREVSSISILFFCLLISRSFIYSFSSSLGGPCHVPGRYQARTWGYNKEHDRYGPWPRRTYVQIEWQISTWAITI